MRDDPTVVVLVERAREGDQAAWSEIARRYTPLVWAVCRQYRLPRADIDDVAANTWLRLVERLGTLREPAALPGWIATTTRRECIHQLRTRSKQVLVEPDSFADESAAEPDDWLLTQERHLALRVALAELPERCRRLLTLLTTDPPTPYTDIADRLGMTIGGIGPTRQRCLDKLRQQPSIAAMMGTAQASGR